MRGVSEAILLVTVTILSGSVSAGQDQTFEIRGSAVGFGDIPVANVRVSLHARDTGSERTIATDATGAFSFGGLPYGHYTLRAEALGFYPVLAWDLSGSERQPRLTLRLPMEVPGFCSQPTPLPMYFRLLDPPADGRFTVLSGTVTNESGSEIQGAAVTLFAPSRGPVATTHTNGEGTFSFANLTVAQGYWIRVEGKGYFAGDFLKLVVLSGYASIYDRLVLEGCEPGHCEPYLRKIQISPRCE
jgi:Carboxypeptidase regulatory-like domain